MMKKILLKTTILASITIFLASCGSTQNAAPAPMPQTAEEAVTGTHENVADEIANEINTVSKTESESPSQNAEEVSEAKAESSALIEDAGEESPTVEAEAEPEAETEAETDSDTNDDAETEAPEEKDTEKVSEEDSNFDKEREEAPTTDEKNKVSEYQIFEEPEVIVFDMPEEKAEPKTEEPKTEEPKNEEIQPVQEEPKPEEPKTEEIKAKEPKTEEPKAEEVSKPAEETGEASNSADAEKITASRSVNIKINQYLDVTYPGAGWTYIGETEKTDSFNYFGRKLGSKNTTFSLRAKKAGKTFLHFYKNDALTGEYIDDYLEVNVENARGTGRIKAPSYADIVPAKPQRRIDRANGITNEENINVEKKEQNLSEPSQKTNKNKLPQNQKKEAAKPSPKVSEPSKPSKNDSPAVPSSSSQQESNIKTIIQTKDGSTHIDNKEQDSTTTAEPAHPQAEEPKSEAYTPVSSQSTPAAPQTLPMEEGPVSSEPVVIVEDKSADYDESLLEKAKKDFVDGKFSEALSEAQEYYNSASTRLDEALFLIAQISESNSQVRDIRFAVDSYDMLVKRFPASKYWKQAKNRSIYLKRFYIDIR